MIYKDIIKIFSAMLIIIFSMNLSHAETQKETLNIYTYDSFSSKWGPGPKIKTAFEKTCDCIVNWVALDDAVSILSRLKLEGNNTKADIALGLDMNLLEEAKASGLFAKHGQNIATEDLNIEWNDDIFIPYDYGYFAFIYDETKLSNPPKSLKSLIDNDENIKIIIQDPRTSSPGLGLLLWVKQVYGNDAAAAWKKLAPKIVTVTKGWWEGYSMFLKGESDMVLSYTTSPAYHIIAEGKQQYKAASFDEGHYMQIEIAAKVATTKKSKLADKFMAFITSKDFQDTIATGNWMFPVAKTSEPLDKVFSQLVKPSKTLMIDSNIIKDNRKKWTNDWLNALSE